ncbi:class I SAM-dependent methyltransferase [Chamaesiphon sp. GL140_3_metabinner_50]|uniref:class I SAM-dependent methyltransferase n=1 Tax=Chamaesiphon sp. GL140_3_metabinner_50 TaxID=2970812 RepID=UPI0025D556B5|nr:class I SAM-dependent methyltransferase [Chamaesiphon sp. GL140_3_metabinner_50]
MADTLTKLTYQTLQQGKGYLSFAHKALSIQARKALKPNNLPAIPVPPELITKLQQRVNDIQAVDWQDAENGVYPTSLLFDEPWVDYLRQYPLLVADLPSIWARADGKKYQDFDRDIQTENYPSYYVQNFHHQTGGYLSDFSANVYDLQVEILFGGSADAMRRRILAPLKAGLQAFSDVPAKQIRILDTACGTARTLRAIRAMLPQASLFGVDLSDAYLRKANEQLADMPGSLVQLLEGNIEELPYVDNYFHAVTCVFLFHELPPAVRQNAIAECYRVLKPGGTFIICDSIQVSDSPELEAMMHMFHETFHEPYYRSYMEDDLIDRLEQAGFAEVLPSEIHFMSKYLVARK